MLRKQKSLKVLNLMGCYWPGHEATGPNQSLRAMMHGLISEADFYVIAKHSPQEKSRAASETEWVDDGYCQTKRLPVNRLTAIGLKQAIRNTPHDIMMCNGFFDPEFTINALVQRRFGKIPKCPCIVSPRGEFASSALAFGTPKKKTYIKLGKSLGLFKDVWFHATAEHEVEAIKRQNLGGLGILTAPNPAKWFARPEAPSSPLPKDKLNLAFLGRISPVKNLLFAINSLGKVSYPVRYHIFGPLVDKEHWEKCKAAIAKLPAHIEVVHKGALTNDDVPKTLAAYDALYLPTQGENFGHAIHESLMSGLPVIISDQTPWRNLALSKAGWDLNLDSEEEFVKAIETLAVMTESDRAILRDSARVFAEERWHNSGAIEATKTMIETVIEGRQ